MERLLDFFVTGMGFLLIKPEESLVLDMALGTCPLQSTKYTKSKPMEKELLYKKGTYRILSYRFWYKPTGYNGREKECQINMQVEQGDRVSTITNSLWSLLYFCEELAPKEYAYIESIQQHFDLLNDDDEGLVRVLEDEGFDFHWLIGLYLEQLQPDDLKDVPEPVDEDTPEEFEPGLVELVNLGDGLCDTYQQTAMQICYKRLAKLHELDKEGLNQFKDLVWEYAYAAGKNNANMVWLAEAYEAPNEVQQETLRSFEPEGVRKRIKNRHHEFGLQNPPFTVQILDWEDWWNLTGSNSAYVYVRYTTDEGEGYDSIDFSCLRDEAQLHFPDIYRRILELEAEQPNYLKKEQPVLVGILAEGWDLAAVAHSYAKRSKNVKCQVKLESGDEKWGGGLMGEYGEYLARKQANEPPSDRVKWLQIVENLHSEVVDAWMAILLRECEVLFEEGIDYRIRDWAVREVMVHASNLFYDFKNVMECLYEGAKVKGVAAG